MDKTADHSAQRNTGFYKRLKTHFKGIRLNVLLKDYTSLRIGGPAKYFYEAGAPADFVRILKFAKKYKIKYFILGGGTNILFSDKEFDGLVVRFLGTGIIFRGACVNAEAGANLQTVIAASIKAGLKGLEGLAGIPGTIGGAIRGNAGTVEAEIGDSVISAKIFDSRSGCVKTFKRPALNFRYRTSLLKKNKKLILLSVVLKLCKAKNPAALAAKLRENAARRSLTQPKGQSAGCIFMNPQRKINGRTMSAGELIDKAGLKGARINSAEISRVHANFFLNTGRATSRDMLALINLAKKKVYEKFKIRLKEEIEIVK